jgi:hypothetical protein
VVYAGDDTVTIVPFRLRPVSPFEAHRLSVTLTNAGTHMTISVAGGRLLASRTVVESMKHRPPARPFGPAACACSTGLTFSPSLPRGAANYSDQR